MKDNYKLFYLNNDILMYTLKDDKKQYYLFFRNTKENNIAIEKVKEYATNNNVENTLKYAHKLIEMFYFSGGTIKTLDTI